MTMVSLLLLQNHLCSRIITIAKQATKPDSFCCFLLDVGGCPMVLSQIWKGKSWALHLLSWGGGGGQGVIPDESIHFALLATADVLPFLVLWCSAGSKWSWVVMMTGKLLILPLDIEAWSPNVVCLEVIKGCLPAWTIVSIQTNPNKAKKQTKPKTLKWREDS